ncbi:MAG: hypothetical protein ACO25L_05810 [Candidatus Nanopelagicales bacterium]|jgi:hypothetical protein
MTEINNENKDNENRDPVLDSLISQIKSNYMENVDLDELIEFDKSKDKSNFKQFTDKLVKRLYQIDRTILITIIITALISVITTFGISSLFLNKTNSTSTEAKTGQMALSEQELKSVVMNLNSVIYWAGPLENAKYTLNVDEAGAAFIRYLPNGEGANDTEKKYLTVATYKVNAAFDAVKAAGNEQDGIGLITADGAAVYYNKNSASNVYLAYPGQDLQIEVFDPTPGRALQLVNTTGLLKPVR